MLIVNDSETAASWFCYNSDDAVKVIALNSGDLAAKGGHTSYHPPDNRTHQYFIMFQRKGGDFDVSRNFANAYVRAGETVTLSGSPGNYQVRVSEGEATGTGHPVG